MMNANETFQALKTGLPMLSPLRHAFNLVWGHTTRGTEVTEACMAVQFEYAAKITHAEGEYVINTMLDAGILSATVIDGRSCGHGMVPALRRTTQLEQTIHVMRTMWPVA